MDDPWTAQVTREQLLAFRNMLLLDKMKKPEAQNRDLEAENAQLREVRQKLATMEMLVEQLEARIRDLKVKNQRLEGEKFDLEIENQQLRDSIVGAARRLQEVVTWNEQDVPKRVDPDREEA